MREKAKRLEQRSNERRTEDQAYSLNVSLGWLDNFKRCWNLRSFKPYGESGDADTQVMQHALSKIKDISSSYAKKSIFMRMTVAYSNLCH